VRRIAKVTIDSL